MLNSVNANFFTVTTITFKFYFAVNQSKQRIIGTSAYVLAWMNVCTTLFYKNVTCKNKLTVCTFYTKTFRLGITAVFCGTHTFFMSEQLNVNL